MFAVVAVNSFGVILNEHPHADLFGDGYTGAETSRRTILSSIVDEVNSHFSNKNHFINNLTQNVFVSLSRSHTKYSSIGKILPCRLSTVWS